MTLYRGHLDVSATETKCQRFRADDVTGCPRKRRDLPGDGVPSMETGADGRDHRADVLQALSTRQPARGAHLARTSWTQRP